MKYLPLFLAFVFVVVPSVAFGQENPVGGLVPCEGPDCTMCSVVELVNGVVKWLIGVLMVVFAIISVRAGFGLVTSGGNPEAKTKAKDALINAFIGLIIVLAAWILVDTLMRAVLDGGSGEIEGRLWSTVTCGGQSTPSVGRAVGSTPEDEEDNRQDIINRQIAGCGTAANTWSPLMPSANLCNGNTDPSVESAVTGGEEGDAWSWSCGDAPCFASSVAEGPPGPPGAPACNQPPIFNSVIAREDLCTVGLGTYVGGRPPLTADFAGTYICGFDPVVECDFVMQPSASIPISCGPAVSATVPFTSFPGQSQLCSGPDVYPDPGAVGSDRVGTDGDYNWNCLSSATSERVSCSVARGASNRCAAGFELSDNARVESLPSNSNLCAIGSAAMDSVFFPLNRPIWTCSGGPGAPVRCGATIIEERE